MRPSIVYVVANEEFGGGEHGFSQLAEALKDGYEIAFACQPGGLLSERLAKLDIPVFPVEFERQISPARVLRLATIFRNTGADLVHSMGSRADFYTRLGARRGGQPTVVSTVAMFVEGYDVSPWLRGLYGFAMGSTQRYCDRFIAVSEAIRRELIEGHGIPAEKVVRIYNGLEMDLYRSENPHREELLAGLGLDPARPVVGTVGRLVYQKAHADLLKAAAIVQREVPEVQFLVVGEGPLRGELEQLSGSLGIRACHFAGFRSDVPDILPTLDVFALSSVLEGLPRVLVEAMACARPCVATSIDGVSEVLEDGINGLLTPPHAPDALAAATVSLLKEPDRARSLARAARDRAFDQFDLRRTVNEVDQLYSEAIRSGATS